MKVEAICIRCGKAKKRPWDTCTHCGFDPTREADGLVKSVYLSLDRYDSGGERERYRSELVEIGKGISQGTTPIYDAGELDRLKKQKAAVDSTSSRAVWSALLRFFLPGIAILVLLLAILLLLRRF